MAKRALVLAGGGLKVGFQAGVLQVLLDEAGLTFDHADGASGGCLNLAMYCHGMTGTQIADQWRNYNPFLPLDLNLEAPGAFAHQQSFFTYDNFRANVLQGQWGLDWNKIRGSARFGTFNLCNFSKKQLEVVPNAEMNEDKLVSAVSLPMWFPPVKINGDLYIDAVYLSDANVEEAIRRGADEIWAIWTVSTRDEWRPGFVSQYFHIIETVADGNFFAWWRRLERNNAAIDNGQPGEFGRKIALRLIQAEVPIHYIFAFSRDRMAEAVNQGVEAARQFCRANNVPLQHAPAAAAPAAGAATSLQFTETMRGFLGAGAGDYRMGEAAGRAANTKLDVTLTIKAADVNAFLVDPNHAAAVTGKADSPLLGGKVDVTGGVFNLLVNNADPRQKEMRYRLFVKHANGADFTIIGTKVIMNDRSQPEIWADTTTLYARLHAGHLDPGQENLGNQRAVGVINIHLLDFLAQMTTFRVEGGSIGARVQAMTRFGELFLGKLFEAYGNLLPI